MPATAAATMKSTKKSTPPEYEGYTESNFARFPSQGPSPVLLSFEDDIEQVLRGTGIPYRPTVERLKPAAFKVEAPAKTYPKSKLVHDIQASSDKEKERAGRKPAPISQRGAAPTLAFGKTFGASCTVPKSKKESSSSSVHKIKHLSSRQAPECWWENALADVLLKYSRRLLPENYAKRVMTIGHALFEQKHYRAAQNVCYGQFTVESLLRIARRPAPTETGGQCGGSAGATTSVTNRVGQPIAQIDTAPRTRDSQVNPTIEESFGGRMLFQSAMEATAGYLRCQYELLMEQDSMHQNRETMESSLRLLDSWKTMAEVIAPKYYLCWITFNATVNMYKIAQNMMTHGYSAQVLPYLIWCCLLTEQCLPLRLIRYVRWRTQLYLAACHCYTVLRCPVRSELMARRALDDFNAVVKAQVEAEREREVDEAAVELRISCLQLNIMIFRRNVFDSRKKLKGVFRQRKIPALKDTENQAWPRSKTERLLAQYMFWGMGSQLMGLLQTMEDPQRRTLHSCRPDPVFYMKDKGSDNDGNDLGDDPSLQDSAQPDMDVNLLMDVWHEVFFAAAEIVAMAMDMSTVLSAPSCTWVDGSSSDSQLDLAADEETCDAITSESAVRLLKFCYCYEMWEVLDFLLPPLLEKFSNGNCRADLAYCKQIEIIGAVRCIQGQLNPAIQHARAKRGAYAKCSSSIEITLLQPPQSILAVEQLDALRYLVLVLESCTLEPLKSAEELDVDMINDALILTWACAQPFFGRLTQPLSAAVVEDDNLTLWLHIAHTVAAGMECFGLAQSDHHLFGDVSMKLALLLEAIATGTADMKNLPLGLPGLLSELVDPPPAHGRLRTTDHWPASLLRVTATPDPTKVGASRVSMAMSRKGLTGADRAGTRSGTRAGMRSTQNMGSTTRSNLSAAGRGGGSAARLSARDAPPRPSASAGHRPSASAAHRPSASAAHRPSASAGHRPTMASARQTAQAAAPADAPADRAGSMMRSASVLDGSVSRIGPDTALAGTSIGSALGVEEADEEPTLMSPIDFPSIIDNSKTPKRRTPGPSPAPTPVRTSDDRLPVIDLRPMTARPEPGADTTQASARTSSRALSSQRHSSTAGTPIAVAGSPASSSRATSSARGSAALPELSPDSSQLAAIAEEVTAGEPPAESTDEATLVASVAATVALPPMEAILCVAEARLQRVLECIDDVANVNDYHRRLADRSIFMASKGEAGEWLGHIQDREETGSLHVDVLMALYRIKLTIATLESSKQDMMEALKSVCRELMPEIGQNKVVEAILLTSASQVMHSHFHASRKETALVTAAREKILRMLTEACQIVLAAAKDEPEVIAARSSVRNLAAEVERSPLPPPPLVVSYHGGTVRLTPQPFLPDPPEKVVYYRLFACQAVGVQPKARLDDYKFPGLGVDLMYTENANFVVRGLKKNRKYVFAVAAYNASGDIIGGAIGRSTEPILMANPLPLIPVTGLLCKVAVTCGQAETVRQTSDLMWDFCVENNALKSFVLSLPSIFLRHFVHSVMACTRMEIQEMDGSYPLVRVCTPGIPVELQNKRINTCKQLLLALNVTGYINDDDLALQIVLLLFATLVREVELQIKSKEILMIMMQCHSTIQELVCAGKVNDKLQKVLHAEPQVMLAAAMIANYMEKCYTYIVRCPQSADLSPQQQKFNVLVINETLEFLSAATGFVLQPSVVALTNQPAGFSGLAAPSPSMRTTRIQTRTKVLQRSFSFVRPKTLQASPAVVSAIKSLLESSAHIATVVLPADERLPPIALDDRSQLHAVIAKLPSSVAYREVDRCRKRAHFLEFFVRLVERSVERKEFKVALEKSEETFAWLTRRNHNMLRKDKEEEDQTLLKKLNEALPNTRPRAVAVRPGKGKGNGGNGGNGGNASLAGGNNDGAPPKAKVKLSDIMADKVRHSVWRCGVKAVPDDHPKENRQVTAALILHALLPLTFRTWKAKKRFRSVSNEEWPWLGRLHFQLAKIHFSMYLDELREQVDKMTQANRDFDKCRLQTSWYDLGTSGGVVVEGGSFATVPDTYCVDDVESMTDEDKKEAFQTSILDRGELYKRSEVPQQKDDNADALELAQLTARRKHTSLAMVNRVRARSNESSLRRGRDRATRRAARPKVPTVEVPTNEQNEGQGNLSNAPCVNPRALVTSSKLDAVKLHLTRALVCADRCQAYMLFQDTVRLVENMFNTIESLLMESAPTIVTHIAASLKTQDTIKTDELLRCAVYTCEVECRSLLCEHFRKVFFHATNGMTDLLAAVSVQRPKAFEGLVHKRPSEVSSHLTTNVEGLERLQNTFPDGAKICERCYPAARPKVVKVGRCMPLQASLRYKSSLDDVATFSVDLRWCIAYVLTMLQRLFLQGNWEVVLDIGMRFNKATRNTCVLHVTPMLLAANQELKLEFAASKMVADALKGKLPRMRGEKDLKKSVHTDPTGEVIYDHVRWRTSVYFDVETHVDALRLAGAAVRDDAHMLHHSRLLKLRYLAGANTRTGEDNYPALTEIDDTSCPVCMRLPEGNPDWMAHGVFPTLEEDLSYQKVVTAYETAIGLLEKGDPSLLWQARAELAGMFFHAGKNRNACGQWELALAGILGVKECITQWRDLPPNISEQQAVQHGNMADSFGGSTSSDLRLVADKFLGRCEVWGCLFAGQLATKLARFSCNRYIQIQAECCLMAYTLFKGSLQASLPHCVMDDVDFAGYDLDPRQLMPGVNLFGDRYRCDPNSLSHDLSWLCTTLVDSGYLYQALPLLSLLKGITSRVTLSVADTVDVMCVQVEVLSNLRLFSKAVGCLQRLLTGHGMPEHLRYTNALNTETTATLMAQQFQDSQLPHEPDNCKTLMYISCWSLHREMTKLYGKNQIDKIDFAIAQFLTEVAAAVAENGYPAEEDIRCAKQLDEDGNSMLQSELTPRLSTTVLAPPSSETLSYATPAALKLVLVEKAVFLFETVHNMALTGMTTTVIGRGGMIVNRPLAAGEASTAARCRLGLARLSLLRLLHIEAAYHSYHALRVLSLYRSVENFDSSAALCRLDARLWLRARLQLVTSLHRMPPLHASVAAEVKYLGRVEELCDVGATEADAMQAPAQAAIFRAWQIADRLKSGTGRKDVLSPLLEAIMALIELPRPHPHSFLELFGQLVPIAAGVMQSVFKLSPELYPVSEGGRYTHNPCLMLYRLESLAVRELRYLTSQELVSAPMLESMGADGLARNINVPHHPIVAESRLHRSLMAMMDGAATPSELHDMLGVAQDVRMTPHVNRDMRVVQSFILLHRTFSDAGFSACVKALGAALKAVDECTYDYQLTLALQKVLALCHIFCSQLASTQGDDQEDIEDKKAPGQAAATTKGGGTSAWVGSPAKWAGTATSAWNLIRASTVTYRASLAHLQPQSMDYASPVGKQRLAAMPTPMSHALCGLPQHKQAGSVPRDFPALIEHPCDSGGSAASTAEHDARHGTAAAAGATPRWQDLVDLRRRLDSACRSQAVAELYSVHTTLASQQCADDLALRAMFDDVLSRHCAAYRTACCAKMTAIGWKTVSTVPMDFSKHLCAVRAKQPDSPSVGAGLLPATRLGRKYDDVVTMDASEVAAIARKVKRSTAIFKKAELTCTWWRPASLQVKLGNTSSEQSVIQFVVEQLRGAQHPLPPSTDDIALLYAANKAPQEEPITGKQHASISVGCRFFSQRRLRALTVLVRNVLDGFTVVLGAEATGGVLGERQSTASEKSILSLQKDLSIMFGIPLSTGADLTEANLSALLDFLDPAMAGEVTNKAVKSWLLHALLFSSE